MKHPSRVFALILLSALVCAAFVPLAGARSTSGGTDAPGVAGGGAPMNTAQSVGPTVTQYAPVMVGPLSPYSAAYDSTNKLVYVADANSPYFNDLEGVTAINGTNWANTFQACTGAGNGPQYLAHDPANNDLYVSCIYPGNVVVINPKTDAVVATVGVGSSPGVVAYDPADQDVYVANYGSNTVSVISSLTNTVVATVATGQEPTWITYSPTNKDVYVIDTAYPYGITVIDGATNALVTTISGEASNAIYDPTSGACTSSARPTLSRPRSCSAELASRRPSSEGR
ncbi:MAG: YncE family protein [Nitrososphaerales archaeon]